MSKKQKIFHRPRPPWSCAQAAVAGVLAVAVLAGPVPAGEVPAREEPIPASPPSLAALYPPSAQAPLHLFAMLGLQESFAGIVVDVLEGDVEGARATFSQFRNRYHQAATLVPEWRAAYPEAPLRELGEALAGGEEAAMMTALDAVGALCHRCHLVTMAPAQQRYRWGSFTAQTVKDPLAGDTRSYVEFKRRLASAFTGIAHDLRQGQTENARLQFQAFSARFATLRESCLSCHATPRRSFTDRDIVALTEELGEILESPSPDPRAVERISARIGQESCSACHLVHVPAAMAQAARR